MTNQINVIQLNNSPILYTKLVPSTTPYIGNLQYIRLNKDNEPLLIETVSIMGTTYRGVTKDGIFWFLVEDIIALNQNSQERLTLITKLLNNVDNKHKGFISAVDSRGSIREVLMVSIEGFKGKLFN